MACNQYKKCEKFNSCGWNGSDLLGKDCKLKPILNKKFKAVLVPVPIGERIYVGDFWWSSGLERMERRDEVGWREKMTIGHSPHFRITYLKKYD